MAKLFLVRHLQSQWNLDNRFAGWTDGPIAKNAAIKAIDLAKQIFQEKIDVAYTSSLFRNMDTVARIFEAVDVKYPFFIHLDGGKMQEWGNFNDISQNDVPAYVSEKLNERHYGKIQGLNKTEIKIKYGEEKVKEWQRSFNVAPPGGESGKDVYKRVIPFFKKYAEKDLKNGKNVLLVASHNSLRALIKYIENISDKKFGEIELPFGTLIRYELEDGGYVKMLS